jgi:hypothetical protein
MGQAVSCDSVATLQRNNGRERRMGCDLKEQQYSIINALDLKLKDKCLS